MSDRHRRSDQKTLDLFEEAVHLLRTAPPAALGWYSFGAIPFILALLYFWTDMSWSADARRDCAVNAAGVALAFMWMKFCQAQFCQRLRAQLKLELPSGMSLSRALRMFLQQAIVQPSKLFVLPLALVATIPFGWLYAFYENVTAFGEARDLRTLWSKSWKQARLWPQQNHLALAIFVLLCAVMSVNVLLLLLTVPRLVKIFTGLENVFTRSGMHVLNSTSLAVVGMLTYFCCDPLLKAVYVLRCFYGESLHSGEDLQVELRRLKQTAAAMASIVLLCASSSLIFGATPGRLPPPTVSAAEIDHSISETIAQPEFRWRMPREETGDVIDSQKKNVFDRALRRLVKTLGKWWRAVADWIERLLPQRPLPDQEGDGAAGRWSRSILEIILIVLCAGLLLLLGMKARDYLRRSRRSPNLAAKADRLDLAQEGVTADQLPEDEWLRLARELISDGDWRLALRALFLAGLAHLSMREMIALARHKSNRDYQGELRRRAPAHSELQDAFGRNLHEVERVWYGRHEVSAETLATFQTNLEKIRTA